MGRKLGWRAKLKKLPKWKQELKVGDEVYFVEIKAWELEDPIYNRVAVVKVLENEYSDPNKKCSECSQKLPEAKIQHWVWQPDYDDDLFVKVELVEHPDIGYQGQAYPTQIFRDSGSAKRSLTAKMRRELKDHFRDNVKRSTESLADAKEKLEAWISLMMEQGTYQKHSSEEPIKV